MSRFNDGDEVVANGVVSQNLGAPGVVSEVNQGSILVLKSIANANEICVVGAQSVNNNGVYITLVPVNTASPRWNNGAGVVVTLDTVTQINNSLSLASRVFAPYGTAITATADSTVEVSPIWGAAANPDIQYTTLADTTGGNVNFTLPLSSTCLGFSLRFTKTDAGANFLLVNVLAGDFIQGSAGPAIWGNNAANTYYTLEAFPDGWRQVSGLPISVFIIPPN